MTSPTREDYAAREWKVALGKRAALVVFPRHQLMVSCSAACAARLAQGEEWLLPDERDDWAALQRALPSQTACMDVEERRSMHEGYAFALNLNLTDACNLQCTYCFARGGSYSSFSNVSMHRDVVPPVVRLMKRHGSPRSRVEFFGGEPLFRFPVIAEVTRALAEEAQTSGTTIVFRVSTNLTVLDDAMVELFARNRFVVSISVDGSERTHDRNRPGKNGVHYYHTILEHAQRLREASDGITLVARVTATGGDESLWEDVRCLNALGIFDYVQVLPVTMKGAESARIHAQFEELYDNYDRLFAESPRFKGNLETEYLVNLFQTRRFAPAFCSAGRTYFAVAQDGQLYPCHRLLGDRAHACGDLARGLADGELSSWNGRDHRGAACGRCWMRYLCGGGCKQDHLVNSGSLSQPSPEFCALQELTCSAALRTCADRIDRRRDCTEELDRLFVSCGRPTFALGPVSAGLTDSRTFTVFHQPDAETT